MFLTESKFYPLLVSVKRQDPMTLLCRYIGTIGIRVVDLFRMFDTENKHYVSREKFIRGLKVSAGIHCFTAFYDVYMVCSTNSNIMITQSSIVPLDSLISRRYVFGFDL